MHPDVEGKREAVYELCRRYRVQTLELFGSATGDRGTPDTSNRDFLVRVNLMSSGSQPS